MVAAVVAFAGLALALDRRDETRSPTDCAALRSAVEQLPPDFPEEARRRLAREVCQAWDPVPVVPTATAVAQPGCGEPNPPAEPVTRRTVRPPQRDGRFLARVRGKLPETGTPVVAGVQLPQGSRCEGHWATDLPVRDPIQLARRLADAFPKTGLWPIVWESTFEGPDAYLVPGNPARADRLDVASELGPGYAGLAVGALPEESEIQRVTAELAIVAPAGETEDPSAPFWRLGWPD